MNSHQAPRTTETERGRDDVRERILASTIELLTQGGRDAVTTRAVADAAGVQPPVIYRLFGDKHGLLEAVAEYGFIAYFAQKAPVTDEGDSVEDLRSGWDLHIDFGLSNPALYLLMYAEPQPGKKPPAAEAGYRMLGQRIRKVAAAGRLRVSEEQAAQLYHASAVGIVLQLLGRPEKSRDLSLSRLAREAALSAITTEAPVAAAGPAASAIALKAALNEPLPLSAGERALMAEWLDRIVRGPAG